MAAEECQRALSSLETHYQQFLQHSADARCFQPDDRMQLQRDYSACTQNYELLLRAQEKGERNPSPMQPPRAAVLPCCTPNPLQPLSAVLQPTPQRLPMQCCSAAPPT